MGEPKRTGPAAEGFPTYTATRGGAAIALTFDARGKYTLTRDGEFAVRGSYRVAGDEITFTDERGPRAGTGDKQVGRYRWKLEDETLTFTLVEDRSEGRKKACSQLWTRQS